MTRTAPLQNATAKPLQATGASLVLQRKCGCGAGTFGLTDECEECGKKKMVGLQTKRRINEPGDIYEQEADRVADQVLAKPAHPDVSSAPPRIQRFTGAANGQADTPPASVDQVLASPGRPLGTALREGMEQGFGYDFSRVRVHSDVASGKSARHVNAHAYTSGYDIVFGAGRFAPGTVEGRRLLAHELTHVVQQTQGDGGRYPAGSIQRDVAGFGVIPAPDDLVDMYRAEMTANQFDGLAAQLELAVSVHPTPTRYVRAVVNAIPARYQDNVGAAFVKRLPDPKLDQIAATGDGRATLNVLYEAIITGDVSEFEREQANRILGAKLRRIGPEGYVKGAKSRGEGRPVPIFPIRFMRVTPGYDYAPPLAKLMPNGRVRVSYPVAVQHMSMFKEEVRTLPNVFRDKGEEFNPNEIVGIKDYEKGGKVEVEYRPALVLIDYSNRAIESTTGKIIEVSVAAATMGFGGGAVAGGRAAANEMVTSTAIWGARLAKTASVLDRAANVIGIASFVINENREWIINKLGWPGKKLVQISDIASSAAAIYGVGRLGQAGYGLVKDMRAASKAAREQGKELTQVEAATLQRLDRETDAMLKELDEAAAKTGAPATPAEKPPVSARVDDPGAAKAPARTETSAPGRPAGKPASAADEIHASAVRANISPQKLEAEVADLRQQTNNPDNITPPKNEGLDAEMTAGTPGDKHRFERNRKDRTWCRTSEEVCELNLGNDLNAKVDDALSEKKRSASREQESQASTIESEAAAGTVAKTAKIDPDTAAKISARDRAREATQKKIAEIERRQKNARKKIGDLKVKIDKTSAKIKQLEEKAKNSTGAKKAQAERDLERARYKLEEEKGGGLRAEREGTIEELTELATKKANLIQALKLERPSLREAAKRAIEAKAPRETIPPYRFLDRKGRPIDGPIHYGHIYGKEHRRLALEAQEKGMNQAQFNEWVNSHPEWFQIESEAENLSHAFEKPGID